MGMMVGHFSWTQRLRFDRHELAGAFGDIGTDMPILIALIATCGLDAASVCIVFGAMQILTGIVYGIPMPVQPLKAMAAIMLAQRLGAGTLAGGGLVIGVVMMMLTLSGLLSWLVRVVPKEVVRGIQLGLGATLAWLALGRYVLDDGARGLALAAVALAALLALRRQSRVPGPLVVIALGVLYALTTTVTPAELLASVGVGVPRLAVPTSSELRDGALLLAVPQLPLSLGNSVIATSQTSRDLFPERAATPRQIGITYAIMNLVAPWLGGVPVCHGCGGLVGFHAFGARTGGAPVIYGTLYLILGLVFAPGFSRVAGVFPMPILGVVLAVEAFGLMRLVRDVESDRPALGVAGVVAAAVLWLPYGYLTGLVLGTALVWIRRGLGARPAPGERA